MKPSFHSRFLNGPFEDPCLFVRVVREGRVLLFDLGYTDSLSVGDVLKISDIFISHTHVDHFIGFDNVLRICLKRERPLRLYGPEGFIDCVSGKLKGYTWNLTEGYPFVMEVSEVRGDVMKRAVYRAEKSFDCELLEDNTFDGTLLKDSLVHVSAVVLDHKIPCLAFSLSEEYHINIDKAVLERLKLPVGPWLGDLKKAIREGDTNGVFSIQGMDHTFEQLRGIANTTVGQKISYVVDLIGSDENRENVVQLVKVSDLLYIEAYFLDEDRERAKERYHLTAKEAGRIAAEAGVGRIETMHYSPKYMDRPERPAREAEDEFRRREGF